VATPQQVRQMVRAEPFRSFTGKLAAGRSFTVKHPENVARSTNGREIAVFDDEGMHLVEMLLVDVIWGQKAADVGRSALQDRR